MKLCTNEGRHPNAKKEICIAGMDSKKEKDQFVQSETRKESAVCSWVRSSILFLAGVRVGLGQPFWKEAEGGRKDHKQGGNHRKPYPPRKLRLKRELQFNPTRVNSNPGRYKNR